MCVGRTNGRSAAADVLDFFFVILRITYLHQGKKYGNHLWVNKRKELKNILHWFEERNTTDNGDMNKRIFTVPILESIFKEIEKKI